LARFVLGRLSTEKILVTMLSISGLGTLAFTQPILSLLHENFEFFTIHKIALLQLIVFTLIVSIIPALFTASILFVSHLLGEYFYRWLALPVNDTLAAVSKTFNKQSGNAYDFDFLVPDSAYFDQENVIRIHEIDGNQDDGYTLALLKGERSIKYAIFRGWAIDPERQIPADQIVLFVDGEFYASARPRTPRPDVPKAYGGDSTLKSGYYLVTDIFDNTQICNGEFEIYALSKNGNASRLTIPKGGLHLDQQGVN